MNCFRLMDTFQDTRDPTARFNPCLSASLRFLSSCANFIVLVSAAAVLVAWMTSTSTLIRPEYRTVVMRPNSALAFILCAISLWAGGKGVRGLGRIIAIACSAVVFLVGAVTVVEHIFDLHLPTDYLLVPVHSVEQSLADPWRMALISGFALVLVSLALFAAMLQEENGAKLSQTLAGITFLAALLGLMDQILNPELSQLHIPMTTVLCLGLISWAIFLRRPDEGAMKVIAADGLGGAMARRLLPAAIIVSILITWVRWRGQLHGYYDAELGAALGVAIQVVLFTWLILANANYLEKADQLRKRAEEVARHAHETMQLRNAAQIVELLERTKELERQLQDGRATPP